VDKKIRASKSTLGKDQMANNQSENILAKLQNLLQNREEEKKVQENVQGLLRNQRGGYANSNGSIKSRASRSKSSGNGRIRDANAPNNSSLMFQS
jgi:hypothetical protein